MPHVQTPADLRDLIARTRTIALVGASPNPARDSHEVMAYLLRAGFTVIPVNPGLAGGELLGQKAYATLRDIPVKVDMVDVFRAADQVPPIMEDAIAIGAKSVWLQLGVVNRQAFDAGLKAGLDVVMDRCIKVDHARLIGR
ncbi:CoA-binding protein [Zavarzinia sp. CC-PAN008]|uniref:CoA-binding protein n=1 Tax=Zavarzinia sp. CC-PAN008 TaxID=3243332 RepID=UPI003F749ADE